MSTFLATSPEFPSHPMATAMEAADLDRAGALVVEAGWNQVRADWEIFLALGQALKVNGAGGSLDATAATLPYAGGFGWISMVLVTQSRRRQGLATALLARCIADLRAKGLVSGLDATPAGRAVYRQRGFADGCPISRWVRTAAAAVPTDTAHVRTLQPQDQDAVAALDTAAFGCPRGELLARLAARSADFACVSPSGGSPRGFLLGRNGRNATQLGPVVAHDEVTAVALLDHAIARQPGSLLIDLLDRHRHVAQALTLRGFVIQRTYTRMTLDRARPFGDERLMVAIAGPELG